MFSDLAGSFLSREGSFLALFSIPAVTARSTAFSGTPFSTAYLTAVSIRPTAFSCFFLRIGMSSVQQSFPICHFMLLAVLPGLTDLPDRVNDFAGSIEDSEPAVTISDVRISEDPKIGAETN